MITIGEYVFPASADEAYALLTSRNKSVVIGGGAFLRMASKHILLSIDLSKASLDYIHETEQAFEIGAMITLGDIERHPGLKSGYGSFLAEAVRNIVGVQFRNIATVGGTVYSRYGFSDFITALLALDTTVKLYRQGIMPLETFLLEGSKERDILESLTIAKNCKKASYQTMRNSSGDYGILNLAAALTDKGLQIAVGARPGRAVMPHKTMQYLNANGCSMTQIQNSCEMIAEELVFGSNGRGSKEYRQAICKVLLRRALKEVWGYED